MRMIKNNTPFTAVVGGIKYQCLVENKFHDVGGIGNCPYFSTTLYITKHKDKTFFGIKYKSEEWKYIHSIKNELANLNSFSGKETWFNQEFIMTQLLHALENRDIEVNQALIESNKESELKHTDYIIIT